MQNSDSVFFRVFRGSKPLLRLRQHLIDKRRHRRAERLRAVAQRHDATGDVDMGVREDGLITSNLARFVPHILE